jgi:K(+)-stimulated pyrophosphate-energized sodium pump
VELFSSVTRYYTGLRYKVVLAIVQTSLLGTNAGTGLATGILSTFPTVLLACCNFGHLHFLQDFMVLL